MSDNNIYSLNSEAGSLTSATNGTLTISGGSGTASNCSTAPYYGYSTLSYPHSQYYPIQIRKIQNGWIMNNSGIEIFLNSLDEVSKVYNKEEKSK